MDSTVWCYVMVVMNEVVCCYYFLSREEDGLSACAELYSRPTSVEVSKQASWVLLLHYQWTLVKPASLSDRLIGIIFYVFLQVIFIFHVKFVIIFTWHCPVEFAAKLPALNDCHNGSIYSDYCCAVHALTINFSIVQEFYLWLLMTFKIVLLSVHAGWVFVKIKNAVMWLRTLYTSGWFES